MCLTLSVPLAGWQVSLVDGKDYWRNWIRRQGGGDWDEYRYYDGHVVVEAFTKPPDDDEADNNNDDEDDDDDGGGGDDHDGGGDGDGGGDIRSPGGSRRTSSKKKKKKKKNRKRQKNLTVSAARVQGVRPGDIVDKIDKYRVQGPLVVMSRDGT
jgi:hypothetical protein